ncbi:MAG TPA: lactonase family protein [Vicinamibacteria bacterium]|nr:lactonase family protein [Vicinamibacteria bacterium]
MTDTIPAFSRLAVLVAVAGLASAVVAAAEKPFTLYVGTYTDGTSRGIYRFTFDPATAATTEPELAVGAKNPSFLALHPNGRFLYAVGEIGSFQGAKTGAVSAFAVDAKTGDLALLNQQPSEGAGPCHLVLDRAGRNVLVANYGGGTVAVLPIGTDGRLKPASSVRAHPGSGPNKGRQEKPHAHGIYLDPAERFALAPDLGADRVFVYRFEAKAGTLEPHGAGILEPGSGPRHLAFHPNGKYVYVINELLSTMAAFSYDGEKGALTSLQTISCLPAGFSGTSWTAEVAVSPDGRFVYGSNRGDDSLAIFAVEPSTGRLTVKGHSPIGGKYPRHFTIDPTGRFILAGHQNSGTIGVLRLDPATGMPSLVGSPVKVDKPVCLLPVPQR